MKIKLDIAKKGERYWWLKCNKNLTYNLYASFYTCKSEEYDGRIIGLILEPFNIRIIA